MSKPVNGSTQGVRWIRHDPAARAAPAASRCPLGPSANLFSAGYGAWRAPNVPAATRRSRESTRSQLDMARPAGRSYAGTPAPRETRVRSVRSSYCRIESRRAAMQSVRFHESTGRAESSNESCLSAPWGHLSNSCVGPPSAWWPPGSWPANEVAHEQGRTSAVCRIHRKIGARNSDQRDQRQPEADGGRSKARGGLLIGRSQDDHEEHERQHDLSDQGRFHRVAAWRVQPVAVRRKSTRNVEAGFAAGDRVQDSCPPRYRTTLAPECSAALSMPGIAWQHPIPPSWPA